MIINRKSDRIVVEFGEGEDKVTAFFSPITVSDKTRLTSMVLPFVKFAGATTEDISKSLLGADGQMDLNDPEKKKAFEELMATKSEVEKFTCAVVKATLKEIHGIEDNDGKPYELSFDPSGEVSDSCLEEVMSCSELFTGITRVSSMILHGTPREGQVLDPQTGQPIPGIFVKKSLKAK